MAQEWSEAAYRLFKEHDVKQVSYVPDAGLTSLIKRCAADNDLATVGLTTEEEGVALAAGAWLGGEKSVLLMQSSGVGNTINAIASLITSAHFPLFTIVTMRGQWGEGNPWQVPMGQAVAPVLQAVGVKVFEAQTNEEVGAMIESGLRMAYSTDQAIAVLVSQRVIGSKIWVAGEKEGGR